MSWSVSVGTDGRRRSDRTWRCILHPVRHIECDLLHINACKIMVSFHADLRPEQMAQSVWPSQIDALYAQREYRVLIGMPCVARQKGRPPSQQAATG